MGRGGQSSERSGTDTACIVKSKTDEAEYEYMELSNRLQVLLISDSTADKAAAAMDVRVGSMSDPKELPGLAHFLEHMLFYSNEKYPVEDEYMKFMAEHGGGTNAYTSAEDTNYHFFVNCDSLEPALDRFAQFFICPLISEDGVSREANAVDSEHGKNVNSDAWRFSQLWRTVANSSHSFSYFHTGNLETLITQPKKQNIDAHSALKDFAEAKYSANLMRLVVFGNQSLSELKQFVRSSFEGVRNKDCRPPTFTADALREDDEGILLKVVPQRDSRSLFIQWAVPGQQSLYTSTPTNLLGHLLGYEGKGSCFSHLKEKGWVLGLSAGESGSSFHSQGFFSIHITLTKEGQNHVEEIGQAVFSYVSLIQSSGVTQKRFDEYQALQRLQFDFRDKAQPENYASALAQRMQEVADKRNLLLACSHVPIEFDPAAVHAVLERMTPRAARLMLVSKDFQGHTDATEQWYGTEYSLQRLPDNWIQTWENVGEINDLHLPSLNPFVPTELDLIASSPETNTSPPEIVLETKLLQIWHKTTTEFNSPKAVVYLSFHNPEAYSSPENAVLCRIFGKLVDDTLNELSYDAHLAGLDFGILPTLSGILVSFSGYNHKMLELVKQVLSTVLHLKVEDQRFQVQKEAVSREISNKRYEQPYQTAMNTSSVIHEATRWHWNTYEEVIGEINEVDIKNFIPQLFRKIWVQGFVTGNLSKDASLALGDHVQNLLQEEIHARPLFSSEKRELRVIQLEEGCPALYAIPTPNPENENSAIMLSYQIGPDNPAEYMKGELWVKCLKQEAFHKLRTQQQLGYIVALTSWSNLTISSIAFILQSSSYPAHILEDRCEQFLEYATEKLDSMSEEEFQQHVEELMKAKKEKNKRLKQQAAREWREIDEGTLAFDRKEQEIAALQACTKQLVASFAQVTVISQRRRKLAVHVQGSMQSDIGSKDQDENAEVEKNAQEALKSEHRNGSTEKKSTEGQVPVKKIRSVDSFKRRQKLYASSS